MVISFVSYVFSVPFVVILRRYNLWLFRSIHERVWLGVYQLTSFLPFLSMFSLPSKIFRIVHAVGYLFIISQRHGYIGPTFKPSCHTNSSTTECRSDMFVAKMLTISAGLSHFFRTKYSVGQYPPLASSTGKVPIDSNCPNAHSAPALKPSCAPFQ